MKRDPIQLSTAEPTISELCDRMFARVQQAHLRESLRRLNDPSFQWLTKRDAVHDRQRHTDRIELHEDDVETVARHMWEVEDADDDSAMPAARFEEMAEEDRAIWVRWTRAACLGAIACSCGVGVPAWTAARGMARVLAERRAG